MKHIIRMDWIIRNKSKSKIVLLIFINLMVQTACNSLPNINSNIIVIGEEYTEQKGKPFVLTSKSINYFPLNEGQRFIPNKIIAEEDKIFSTGYFFDGTRVNACYWDGYNNLIELSPEYKNSFSNSLHLFNDTVYVVGDVEINGIGNACYWKSEKLNLISIRKSTAYSIFVENNEVYTVGKFYGKQQKEEYFYSKGKSITTISGIPTMGNDLNLYVKNEDVYISGAIEKNLIDKACYWINGDLHELNTGSNYYSYATSIFVHSDTVYVCGYYTDGTRNMYNQRNPIPCIWKNGVFIKLEGTGRPYDIFADNNGVQVVGDEKVGNKNYAYYWTIEEQHIIRKNAIVKSLSIIK